MGFFFRRSKTHLYGHLPEFAQAYLSSCEPIKGASLIDQLRFVVFDTETTSLDMDKARLLSLGAVSCVHDQVNVGTALDCYVSWGTGTRPENVEIHGITQRRSDTGMEPEEVIAAFLNYIQGAVLVAHHVDFDEAVINAILHKYHNGLKLVNPKLDTAKLAMRLEHSRFDKSTVNPKNYSLDALMERYDIDPLERHSALGDAYSTALLLMKLLYKLRKRGVQKLKQLTR